VTVPIFTILSIQQNLLADYFSEWNRETCSERRGKMVELKKVMRHPCIFIYSLLTSPFLTAIDVAADVTGAVKTVAPNLVRIETIGGHEKVGSEFANEGTSTGILLDHEGYVLTGAFNFLHDPATILLVFSDGTKKVAKKIATDRLRMLTLLKANDFVGNDTKTLAVRSKSSIRIGERCIAVGLVFSAEPNIALGIISGKDRIWGKALQTDAAIGPNNYGGLLIDFEGNVLGIPVPLSMMSNSVTAGAELYDAGVGMAIPWEDAMVLLPKLKEGKDLLPGWLGFGFKENQTFIGEPVIAVVQPDSPAAQAGLKVGDRIVKIDGVPMPTALGVTHNVMARYVGETLTIAFQRDGAEQTVSLTAAER
jgi:serine protease Do